MGETTTRLRSVSLRSDNGVKIGAETSSPPFSSLAQTFRVRSTDPEWPLMSEGLEGLTTFSVMVDVAGPEGSFVRQLLADHPEHTEDLIFTDDQARPMQRALKVLVEQMDRFIDTIVSETGRSPIETVFS